MTAPELAKSHLDVGLFTNRASELGAFYSQQLGLPFAGLLPLGPLAPLGAGLDQHRYTLSGSVLKINQCADPLPPAVSGYRRLVIAAEDASYPRILPDPDGLEMELVPPGHEGVTSIGIVYEVADVEAVARFLTIGLGAQPLGRERYRLGDTVLALRPALGQPRSGTIRARGLTYLTVQVRDVLEAHRHLVDLGAEVVTPPARVGDVAAVSFVRDPGGNWIELAHRADLAGPLPDLEPAPG